MTPLQKAAQQVIEQWDAPLWKNTISTAHFIGELRKALEAEQAQAVEPMAWIERDMQCDDFDPDSVTCATPVGTAEGWEWVPLYLQPAPPPAGKRDYVVDANEMVGERKHLIAELRARIVGDPFPVMDKAADMLEADVRELARWQALAESNAKLVDIVDKRHERAQRLAQQVAVPMTDAEIYNIARMHPRVVALVPHTEIGHFARAIEAHHGIKGGA